MVEVSETLTRNLADLARLELTEEEIRKFTVQLGDIFGYVELLNEVNLAPDGAPAEVEPMIQPLDVQTPLREDSIRRFPRSADGRPKVLSSAPEELYDGFKVPPIL